MYAAIRMTATSRVWGWCHPPLRFERKQGHIMFNTYVFSHLLGRAFGRSESIETNVLNLLGW